ncbi:MAG: gamma-glutamyltranspeptidase / glutathione hydrolase, partial [Pseudomonadota bacterium]|nr:gamma-glutamyltranspeptidase / glutathione hydrolase [Pseudomonadota bacterium]
MIKIPRATALLACVVVFAACQHAPTQPADHVPAAVSPLRPSGVHAAGVAAASPLAVEAGVAILKAGGSAVDAAVAVQAALGLVEPQSSGLGGGAFLLHFDAATGKVTAYDGRETAPA